MKTLHLLALLSVLALLASCATAATDVAVAAKAHKGNVYVPRLAMSPGDDEMAVEVVEEEETEPKPYTEGFGASYMPVYSDALRAALQDPRNEWNTDCCGSSSCSKNDCSYTSCSCSSCCSDDYWYVILGIFFFFILFGGIALCIAATVPYPGNYYGYPHYHGSGPHKKEQNIHVYQRNDPQDNSGDWIYGRDD